MITQTEPKKILIIEDTLEILERIEEVLTLKGYKTYIAENGSQGVQKAIKNLPDLIICDIMMPDMDGYEVLLTLRDVPATTNIPFIFLTAKTQVADFRKGMQLGADDYITKPFRIKEMLESIEKRFEKQKSIRNEYDNQYKILFESPHLGVFKLSALKFIEVNNFLCKIMEYNRTEILQKKITEIIEPKSHDFFYQLIDDLYADLTFKINKELTIITKSKKNIKINLYLSKIENKSHKDLIGTIALTNIDDSSETNKNKIIDFEVDQEKNILKIIDRFGISDREITVLKKIAEGLTNQEIADALFISKRTVEGHRSNLLLKTGAKNTAELVAFSFKHQIIK